VERFSTHHPSVLLEPDVLFIDDGDVLTSAGSAAAPDLALHVVRREALDQPLGDRHGHPA